MGLVGRSLMCATFSYCASLTLGINMAQWAFPLPSNNGTTKRILCVYMNTTKSAQGDLFFTMWTDSVEGLPYMIKMWGRGEDRHHN